MALDITRRADGQRALVQEEDYQYHVQSLSHQVITEMAVIQAQREKVDGNAATAIGAGGRGMLARCLARELRAERNAATAIQRRGRGMAGRAAAEDQRWLKKAVAPSNRVVKAMHARSTLTMTRGEWVELVDPWTGSFWYYWPRRQRSTWIPPVEFEKDLFCAWRDDDGCVCGKEFLTMGLYQQHRLRCHSWWCDACGAKQPSLFKDKCPLCANGRFGDGAERESHLQSMFDKAWRRKLGEPSPRAEDDDDVDSDEYDDGSTLTSAPTAKTTASSALVTQDLPSGALGSPAVGPGPSPAGDDGDGPGAAVPAEAPQPDDQPSTTLLVCRKFEIGRCTKTTCPRAHPGLRDSAEVLRGENAFGASYRYVDICQEALPGRKCEAGDKCPKYHPYIRPPTLDIVKRLYPRKVGFAQRVLASGAKYDGVFEDGTFSGTGALTWPNGDVFVGEWVNGIRNGTGSFTSGDGRRYEGAWVHGARHGFGRLEHPNGETYEGTFAHGHMEGCGHMTSANGDTYQGEMCKGLFHGIGTFKKKNGDGYFGRLERGAAHGAGVLVAADIKYRGAFENNQRSGRGVACYKDGSKYGGSWREGEPHGYGVFISGCDERYAGDWEAGKKHGEGRYTFENGDVYDGQFRSGKAHGRGVYFHAHSGDRYVGQWVADRKSGKGSYLFKSGSRYEGSFYMGHLHGGGALKFANGASYVGEWRNSQKHGMGVFVFPNGGRYHGKFENNSMAGGGEMSYVTGHRYVGQWARSKKNGHGTFYYNDGNVYSGQFFDDNKQGSGKMVLNPGILAESYDGQWVKNQRHGRGVYRYKKMHQTTISYDGEWSEGIRHGYCEKMLFVDGGTYKGDMENERMHGVGCRVWADGSRYDGEWVNNSRHGRGVHLNASGDMHQGAYFNDKKHGSGLITYSGNGNSMEGTWKEGMLAGGTGRYSLLVGDEVPGVDQIWLRVRGA